MWIHVVSPSCWVNQAPTGVQLLLPGAFWVMRVIGRSSTAERIALAREHRRRSGHQPFELQAGLDPHQIGWALRLVEVLRVRSASIQFSPLISNINGGSRATNRFGPAELVIVGEISISTTGPRIETLLDDLVREEASSTHPMNGDSMTAFDLLADNELRRAAADIDDQTLERAAHTPAM